MIQIYSATFVESTVYEKRASFQCARFYEKSVRSILWHEAGGSRQAMSSSQSV